MTPPAKEKCPNFKVDEFFCWMPFVMKHAWHLLENFSIDKPTCKMQDKLECKTCCGKFKRIGDGLQANCLANNSYTWDFNFVNEPVDIKWTNQGIFLMHARVLHMWEKLEDDNQECKMDNFYNSVHLRILGFSLKNQVKIHSVLRKGAQGCFDLVFQDPLSGKRAEAA